MSLTNESLKEILEPFMEKDQGNQIYLEACSGDIFRGEISNIRCTEKTLVAVRLLWYVRRVPGRGGVERWQKGGFWTRIRNRRFSWFSTTLNLTIASIKENKRSTHFQLIFVTNLKEDGALFLSRDPSNLPNPNTTDDILIPPAYQLNVAA